VRELCDAYGVVLIFDEVKTGFRLAKGGAQEYFGVKADLAAYAKAMGNGFPVSAVAGRDEIMAVVEPGRVAHGGTYCGNVVAATAAAATLEIIETQPVIETIFANGRRLMAAFDAILGRAGVPHAVTGVPSMFSVLLGKDEAADRLSQLQRVRRRALWAVGRRADSSRHPGRRRPARAVVHVRQPRRRRDRRIVEPDRRRGHRGLWATQPAAKTRCLRTGTNCEGQGAKPSSRKRTTSGKTNGRSE
jgi:hypothetical protein